MGLNINTLNYHGNTIKDYARLGGYGRIHVLRRWLLINKEGNSEEKVKEFYAYSGEIIELKAKKYPALIDHSDAEGGYISFSEVGIVDTKNKIEWADLDKLKAELKEIKGFRDEMPEEVKAVFDDFYEIVFPEDEESTFVIFS